MKKTIALVSVALLAGCVRTETSQIDARTAIISARGTAFDTPAKVQLSVMVEAAKMTQAHGFKYFALLSAQDATTHGAVYIPGQTTSNTTVTGFGNSAYATTTTYTSPGSVVGIVKPGEDITIRMFKEGEVPANAPGVWEAASILAQNPPK
ncbi:hypothetical protein [uncultured Devosia sp.]|uniref:hypothetical protein n=1 Tax=uncultured Devosia sp. TaxID=211434 RepID=UPI002615DB34|nr:hypothetical protein [uncultured Devosia sp.]